MTPPLIRPEVFAARRQQWLGEVRVALPRTMRGLIGVAVLSACLLVLLLAMGSYTRRANVIGELVPAEGLLRLEAGASGSISAIAVHEGSQVRRGDTLLLIDVEQRSAALADGGELVATQLLAQVARLERNARLAALEAERGTAALQEQLAGLGREQRLIENQRTLRRRQLDQARQALSRIAPLQQSGVVSRYAFGEYEQAALSAETALNENQLRLVELQGRQRDVAAKLSAHPSEAAARDSELQGEKIAVTRALAQAEVGRVLRVTATRDGTVSGLAVQLGQSVAAGRRLMSLVPQHSPLVAQLWVPSGLVGQVKVGDRVVLRTEQFPHQGDVRFQAVVEQIATAAMSPDDIRQIADRSPDYPAFRVVATLESPTSPALRASTQLVANLQLERRSLIRWLWGPFAGAGGDLAP